MANDFLTLDDYKNLRGKTVLVRVDLNSPVEKGKIILNKRFEAHAKTVALLSSKGAKVVVLAHQGRLGDDDCISLRQHAALLSKTCGKKVFFEADKQVVSEKTVSAIKKLKGGQAILLENLRFLKEEAEDRKPEEHARGKMVAALAPLADLFVNDAFSNSHRSHESMVGFPAVMASCAGPVLAAEVEGALKAREHAKRPNVYVLGGSKPKDAIELMEFVLKKNITDKILTCGVIGELCLIARGNRLSSGTMSELLSHKHTDLLLPLRGLIHQYHEFIETPFDFAVDEGGARKEFLLTSIMQHNAPIGDIGVKTSNKYSKIILKSKTVYLKGPPGKFEEKIFENGTKAILTAAANSSAYTLLGGGHSGAAAEKLGIPLSKFSFVSLSGGALEKFMQGKTLPAISALEESARTFGAKPGAKKMPAEEKVPHVPVHKTKQAKLHSKNS